MATARCASPNGDVAHVSVVLPDGDELGLTSEWPIALSDDGTRVAYAGFAMARLCFSSAP